MITKIKAEILEYNFKRGIIIQVLISFVVSWACLYNFTGIFPEGCFGEYIIFSLDNKYVVLVLLPLLLLLLTGDKYNEVCRYPVLIRYQNRNEFFYYRVIAKIGFAFLFLIIYVGMLLATGIWSRLPVITAQAMVETEEFEVVILKLFANVFGYLCFMLLLHEITRSVFSNNVKDIGITVFFPIINLGIVKLQMRRLMLWTPWGNVAYLIGEQERKNYSFYWWYWLFSLLMMFYLADVFYKRKDYVFEKNYKA